MRLLPVAATLSALLVGCGDNRPAAEAETSVPLSIAEEALRPPGDPSPLADPAAQPVEGDANSAWVELMGGWAQTGRCGDDAERWLIEGEAFHRYEMHCAVERLDLLRNGVKATAQCSVEGDDDGEADVFWFLRQGDASLTIVEGEGGFANTGFFLCEESVEL